MLSCRPAFRRSPRPLVRLHHFCMKSLFKYLKIQAYYCLTGVLPIPAEHFLLLLLQGTLQWDWLTYKTCSIFCFFSSQEPFQFAVWTRIYSQLNQHEENQQTFQADLVWLWRTSHDWHSAAHQGSVCSVHPPDPLLVLTPHCHKTLRVMFLQGDVWMEKAGQRLWALFPCYSAQCAPRPSCGPVPTQLMGRF